MIWTPSNQSQYIVGWKIASESWRSDFRVFFRHLLINAAQTVQVELKFSIMQLTEHWRVAGFAPLSSGRIGAAWFV
jgi:hypothetical protein